VVDGCVRWDVELWFGGSEATSIWLSVKLKSAFS
jgi:hypothetical protein